MPVLKVKEDGVWKKVGSGSGSSGSCACGDLSASVGDITALATTDKTSLVAAINELAASAGGSGSGEVNVLVVTVDPTTMTASHSASEIYDADLSGKLVLLKPTVSTPDFNGTVVYQGTVKNGDSDFAVFSCLHLMNNRFVNMISGHIDENKVCSIYNTYGYLVPHGAEIPTPTESDYGKVLSATANGLVWVAQSSGGSGDVPSAEGVEF